MTELTQILPNTEKDFFFLYHHWYSKLYSFVYKKTSSKELAEDVAQNTFLKVWERRRLFNENILFSTQLFQIARTSLIDELRRQALSRKYSDYERPFLSRMYENMELQLQYRDELEQVKKLLKQMPLMRQRVFFMHKFDELSYKEIAVQLEISPRTVENHISLALKFIRRFFKML